jgi:DNA-binding PadR family transcriptional regulator
MPLTVTALQLFERLKDQRVEVQEVDVYHLLRMMHKNGLISRLKGPAPLKGGHPRYHYELTERQVTQIRNLFTKED